MMTMDWQSLDPQVPGKQDIEHLYSFGLAFEQYICSCNLCIPNLCSGMEEFLLSFILQVAANCPDRENVA